MKVAFINPPIFSAFAPPLGILSLSAYLEEAGITTLKLDASINALHFMMNPFRLKENWSQSQERYGTTLKPVLEQLCYEKRDINERYLLEQRDIALDLWTEDGFKLTKAAFTEEISAINQSLTYGYCHFYPTLVTTNLCLSKLGLLSQKSQNPFLEYYHQELLPELRKFAPDVICVSFCYKKQFLPGLSLIQEIKNDAKVPLIVGGSFFSILCSEYLCDKKDKSFSSKLSHKSPPVLKAIYKMITDCGIHGEGEKPLLEICHRLETKRSLFDVKGLIYKANASKTLFFNEKDVPLSGKQLPPLNLGGLPIGAKYLTPIPIAPLSTSRGCYWNKCTFCDHAKTIDSRYRELSLDTIITSLRNFKENGIEFVFFCDEGILPSILEKMSTILLDQEFYLPFGVMSRFENKLPGILRDAARAGLKSLSFGLESGSERIVSLMNKGYDHQTAQRIIDACFEANVRVQLFTIFGFPTETVTEAEQTNSFLEKNKEKIDLLQVNIWGFVRNSEIGQNMNRFGVVPLTEPPVSYNPKTYKTLEGIGFKKAVEFQQNLKNHPDFGHKILSPLKTEEYFMIRHLSNT